MQPEINKERHCLPALDAFNASNHAITAGLGIMQACAKKFHRLRIVGQRRF